MKKINYNNLIKYSFVPTFIHYLISFYFTLDFVEMKNFDIKANFIFLIIELLFFTFLYFSYKNIPKLVNYKHYIKTFSIYFLIQFIVLLCVWPGVWRWDEIWVAFDAKKYVLDGWQNILTSIFYIFSFKLIPSYVGVVIIQCIFISMIVSYVINKIYEFLELTNRKCKILLYIPFLLLPVLDNNLYPIRSVLYSYLILCYGVKLIDLYRSKTLSWKNSLILIALIPLLSSLRNEGIYFLGIFIIIYIYFFKMKKITLKMCVISITTVILTTFYIYLLNSMYMGYEKANSYNITSTTGSLIPLVHKANENGEIKLLGSLNKIIDVDSLLKYSVEEQSTISWNKLIKYENLDNYYKEYMKAYIKLNFKYPFVVLENKKNDIDEKYNTTFINLFNSSINYKNENELFKYYNNKDFVDLFLKFESSSNNFSKPINTKLRENVISILEGRTIDDYHKKTILYKLWYIYPPLIINFIFFLFLLARKKWFYLFVYFSMIMKFALVYVTQPSFLFMYYFSDYLIGYLSLVILILLCVKRIKISV